MRRVTAFRTNAECSQPGGKRKRSKDHLLLEKDLVLGGVGRNEIFFSCISNDALISLWETGKV